MRRRGRRSDNTNMITTHRYHQQRARRRFVESAVMLAATLAVVATLVLFIGTQLRPIVCVGRSLASPTHTCSAER